MKNPLRILALACGIGLFLLPQMPWAAGDGSTGAEFLKIHPGARSGAMGGAVLASGGEGESLYDNPAGILELVNPQIYFSHLAWWESVTYDSIWGVQPLGEQGTVGAAVSFLNVPPFNSTEDPGLAADSAWDLLAKAGYAYKFDRAFSAGGMINYVGTQLADQRTWGLFADAGMKYFLWNDRLTLACTLSNIGFIGAFQSTADALPMQMGLGSAYRLAHNEAVFSVLEADIRLPLGGKPSWALGTETWLWGLLALRAGVTDASDAGDWLSCGLGAHWQQFHLDYALKPLGLLGPVHQLSAGYDFGSQTRLAPPSLQVRLINRQVVYSDGETGSEVDFMPTCKIPAGLDHWSLALVNRSGQMLRNFAGGQTLPLRVTWDSKDEQGKSVDRESYYTYRFQVADRRGYTDEVSGEILPVSITRLPKLKALPRDIFAGRVTFVPKGSENASEWSISILNAQGQVLKKFQGVGAFPKDFAWNGKDEGNRKVSIQEGFHYILQVKDRAGNEMKSVAPLAQIDAGTKACADTNLPLAEQVVFRFHIQPEIKFKGWSLDVVSAETGKVVRTYAGDGRPPDSVTWDTRDEQGRVVPLNQKFNYVLRLQDHIGNVWQQASELETTPVAILSPGPGTLKIKIDQILFEFNRAELLPNVFDKLRKAADIIKSYPAAKVRVLIEGHTDEVGTEQFNYDLSLNRANMVMRYLVEEEGVASSLLEVKGLGKTVPLFTGSSEKSAKNRRVEITLYLSQ